MNQTYKAINKLSKAVYDQWGAKVTFDFASFAKETRDFSFRITWSLGEGVRQELLNGGERFIMRYRFECIRYLESEMSNLYEYLTDLDNFVTLLQEQEWSILSIGAIDTATPDRVSIIIEAH